MSHVEAGTPTADGKSGVPALEARNLAKSFGTQRALKDVHLSIAAGEVVALLGENGSGKSTLVKILSGYHEPEPGGALAMNGVDVPLPVPLGQARTVGLSFVYQDLGLAGELQVVENLFAGRRVSAGLAAGAAPINWRAEHTRARAIFARYGVELDPGAQVGRLRPTQQALLAIIRAANELSEYRTAHGLHGGVLVLDEPTVFLPEHEKVFLFDLVRRVTADGIGVLFVSHDMTAVREIAHRAVVLRDGAQVGDVLVAESSDADLIELVSGHHLDRVTIDAAVAYGTEEAVENHGATVLSVSELHGGRLHGISFDLHAGEILGVAGLLGAGSEDLPYVLFGGVADSHGSVSIGDWSGDVSELTPSRSRALEVALVPADRKQQGAVADLSVGLNMLSLSFKPFIQGGFLRMDKLLALANQRTEAYSVRPGDAALNMAALSGGNQQKVVLARWLEQSPKLLLLHEPTQGVDVGTRHQIYDLMRARADSGVAILWVSTDFDELATVSHRIMVCSAGVSAGVLTPPYNRDRITSEVYSATARGGARGVNTP